MQTKATINLNEEEVRMLRRMCAVTLNLERLGALKVNKYMVENLERHFDEMLRDYFSPGNLLENA